MKTCTDCKEQKSLTDFYKCKTNKDGLQYRCKICLRNYYQTPRGKIIHQEANRKYYRTFNGKLRTCWKNINSRCNKSHHKEYKNYGGRGIKNLFTSFQDFYDYIVTELHIDSLDKISRLQIDRRNNNGNYVKGNIRFVTPKENSNNKR